MVPVTPGLPEISDSQAECPQCFFRKGLAGPGGELDGRDPGDEEELRFFEDVDEETAAPKVFNFLHPLQVDEVALHSGVGDEGDASRTLVQPRGPEGEEVTEVCHRRLDADPGLAGVGEDRQQGDRLGM
jgi:hypothetical protein